MTYEETLHYLFTSTPVFEQSGASAYKPGLDTSIALDNYFNNPHKSYQTIHVGGTNGKGSVCNLLAAILQKAGYKVGLYTSPHLVDFRERIRVNGQMISQKYVIDFVKKHNAFFEPLHPSFFELTSTMALDYFRAEKVDIAVIEVGLGGRLDSTNIIHPLVSVITNISKDHMQFLGETTGEIAYEKAGIIKVDTPVIIGEATDEIVANVFIKKAKEMNAPLFFTDKENVLTNKVHLSVKGDWSYDSADYGRLIGQLNGLSQIENTQTVLCTLRVLASQGIRIPEEAVNTGFEHVIDITGLQGRWQEVLFTPYTILDTGHNAAAWEYLTPQIEAEANISDQLYIIIGLSNDKDVEEILRKMPRHANYLFTQASVNRALPAKILAMHAEATGLHGEIFDTVVDAIYHVLSIADDDDMIFIGGSSFVVADALPLFNENNFK